jgi:hypothetical protein
MARHPGEAPDIDLADELIFRPHGLSLQPFTREELLRGKTPDRRVLLAGELAAFTEIKSPRDDWMEERFEEAAPGEMVGGLRADPIFNRIRRHIRTASEQFDAVNPSREHPNILVLVNHDTMSDYRDLRETVTGYFHADTGERFPTMKREADRLIEKNSIDAIAWIDARDRRLEGYMLNEQATPNLTTQVCALLGVDPANIRR